MNPFSGNVVTVSLLASAVSLAAVVFTYAQNAPPARPRPQVSIGSQGPMPVHEAFTKASIAGGQTLFQQNCAFCHGKEAGGGESGPDLTRSKIVTSDRNGENIAPVVKNGRLEKGMPRFNLPDADVMNLVAFVHSQQDKAMSQTGVRKGVDVSDLQTGNVEAGKAYFNGPGTCSTCHSPTGDLAGIATKYEGLKLEREMLYPEGARAKVTVTTSAGKVETGQLTYLDEFAVGLTDANGVYHSWPSDAVKFKVDAPFKAHVTLFDKYTDADIHNLMAYLQTLR